MCHTYCYWGKLFTNLTDALIDMFEIIIFYIDYCTPKIFSLTLGTKCFWEYSNVLSFTET